MKRRRRRRRRRLLACSLPLPPLSFFLLQSLSLSLSLSLSELPSPLAHAPRPGGGNRLLAELLHGDDVDAAHGAFVDFYVIWSFSSFEFFPGELIEVGVGVEKKNEEGKKCHHHSRLYESSEVRRGAARSP